MPLNQGTGMSQASDLKHNLAATAAPATTDDISSEYQVGSLWIDVTNDQSYICVDSTANAAVWIRISVASPLYINAQTGTSYTAALTDKDGLVTMSNASANTLTIPTNASVAFPVGTRFEVVMLGAGTTSITGDTGVTLNGVSAGSGDINNQYQGIVLTKLATNTWLASGDIGTVA